MTRDVDLLITGGTVVTMDEERRLHPSGWIGISGNRIVAVGPGDPPDSTGQPKRRIDATGTVVMPGLVSCHGHASNSLVRGMAEDRPLHEWLTEVLWPAMSHAGPDEVYRGALLSAVEMLRSGVTCCADMWTEVSSTARAVEQVGLRALRPQPAQGSPRSQARPYLFVIGGLGVDADHVSDPAVHAKGLLDPVAKNNRQSRSGGRRGPD